MRLKKYTPDTVGKQKRGKAFVKMNVVGLITFSTRAGEMMAEYEKQYEEYLRSLKESAKEEYETILKL